MLTRYSAFIFDLDGTLVDSGSIIDRVMTLWCNEQQLDYAELRRTSPSTRTVETVRAVAPHLDAQKEAERIESMERDALEDLKEISGAASLLASLPREKWAVATSSGKESAVAKLEAAGLPLPPVLICAENVEQGKPAPDAFANAATALGYAPEKCLAFEDSNIGTRAALNAGCDVIIIGNKCTIEDARVVGRCKDLSEFPARFAVTHTRG